MDQDLKDLLSALNAHNAKYLVVGGYAVSFHSEPRATKDLDVLVRSDEVNSELVFRALMQFGDPLAGYSSADFQDESTGFSNPPSTPPNRHSEAH